MTQPSRRYLGVAFAVGLAAALGAIVLGHFLIAVSDDPPPSGPSCGSLRSGTAITDDGVERLRWTPLPERVCIVPSGWDGEDSFVISNAGFAELMVWPIALFAGVIAYVAALKRSRLRVGDGL
jgi:hypothetical protein